jgi:hypothetical protein
MSRSLLGWVGVFCFTIFLGIAILALGVLDAIPFFLSPTGRLTFLSLPLAALVLTTVAGFRHSKWWLVVAGLIACLLLFIFIRLWTGSGTDGMFRPLEKTGYVPSVPVFPHTGNPNQKSFLYLQAGWPSLFGDSQMGVAPPFPRFLREGGRGGTVGNSKPFAGGGPMLTFDFLMPFLMRLPHLSQFSKGGRSCWW